MAVARDWQDFVVEQLRGAGRVTARRMFGGVGLYLEETFFGLIASSHDVFFKVDDGNRAAYETAGMAPFRPFADKAYAMSRTGRSRPTCSRTRTRRARGRARRSPLHAAPAASPPPGRRRGARRVDSSRRDP